MEHLFKLKKDGKTVGYYRFAPYRDEGDMELQMRIDGKEWWSSGDMLDFDSIHPFVTKDKNGKDVFADDEITFVPVNGFGTEIQQRVKVYFCNRRLAFCVKSKAWDIPIKHNCLDIELIEGKQDEN